MVRRGRFPPRAPYLIASLDVSPNDGAAPARRLIELAAEAGADAVKVRMDASSAAAALPKAIARAARGRVGLIVAPVDAASVPAAARLKPAAYQIDPPFLGDGGLAARLARERRPVFIVAGACSGAGIRRAVRALGACPLVLLHTVAADALPPDRARLRHIEALHKRFPRHGVGYLGAEPGIGWAFAAVALGAVAIEKPLVLDRSLASGVRSGSLDPRELAELARGLRDLERALAPVGERRLFAEELPLAGETGRSLVARRALRRGARLRARDFDARTSSAGLSPRLAEWLVGRPLAYDVDAGEPITFGLVE